MNAKFLLFTFLLVLVTATSLVVTKTHSQSETNQHTATKTSAPKVREQATNINLTSKVIFIGDVMLARTIGERILQNENPFQYVQTTLDQYELRIANLETTIAAPNVAVEDRGKLYTFNAPVAALDILKLAHIDAVSLANNHTHDFGSAATANMLTNLQRAGIKFTGAGNNVNEAFTPLILDIPFKESPNQKVKLALIGVNNVENSFTNVTDTQAGSAYFDKSKIAEEIKNARAKADIIIVFPHWGTEYQTAPSKTQTDWGHFFIDQGVDMVIGSHPHVVQTTENYQGKFIVYSLGNFIFDGMGGNALDGEMISLRINLNGTVDKEGNFITGTRKVTLSSPTPIPTHIDNKGFPELK